MEGEGRGGKGRGGEGRGVKLIHLIGPKHSYSISSKFGKYIIINCHFMFKTLIMKMMVVVTTIMMPTLMVITHPCSKVAMLTLKLRHYVLNKHTLQLTLVLLLL